jgi:hypothetical protein
MPWTVRPLPDNPIERIPIIIWNLLIYIGQKHRPGVDMEYLGQVYWYVERARRRLARLVERFRDGSLCPPRPRARPRSRASETDEAALRPQPAFSPPRNYAWLCGLVPQWAASCGGQLLMALDTEEMRAMAEAGPQLGRVLRPLMWALAVTEPAYLNPKPRPRPRRARVVAPAAAPANADPHVPSPASVFTPPVAAPRAEPPRALGPNLPFDREGSRSSFGKA